MFSKLVSRNSKRDRKNNGLYFSSMVLSIISFYIILSLSHQDVMVFLKQIESHAVEKQYPCPWNRPSYFYLNFRTD